MPINKSRTIRREFSRYYTLNSEVTSYLQEINNWAQFAQVYPVSWTCQPVDDRNPRAGFYAIPKSLFYIYSASFFLTGEFLVRIVINRQGIPYMGCCGQGRSHEEALQRASQLLFQQARIDANELSVRWKFSESRSNFGTVHCAIPIVYGLSILSDDWNVIGCGQSHQQAKEDSAHKLFQHGYCHDKIAAVTIFVNPIGLLGTLFNSIELSRIEGWKNAGARQEGTL
ncbi:hypothetical protein FRC12_004950 [Ceratobasidium sp. 428]|nr:hypothetical protein FRC12_004950 [Ceratobasidium sp. 428]